MPRHEAIGLIGIATRNGMILIDHITRLIPAMFLRFGAPASE